MKKIIFFSMLLAIGVSAYANHSVVINENNNSNTIVNVDKLIISITWGHVGKHNDCEGHGICVVIEGDIPDMSQATASINREGKLVLDVDLLSVSKEDLRQFYGRTFEMPQSLKLDGKICKALGVRNYEIRRGNYKMVKRGNICSLTF